MIGQALRVGWVGGEVAPAVLARIEVALPASAGPRTLLVLRTAAGALPQGWTAGPPIHGPDAAIYIARNTDLFVLAAGVSAPEAVATALAAETPVLLLEDPPLYLADRTWSVGREQPPAGDAAWAAMRAYLAALLTPPSPHMPPMLAMIEAGARLPDRAIWRTHRTALNALARPPRGSVGPAAPLPDGWEPLYASADHLATSYADRYRSSYTLVLALAAVALLAAVAGLVSEAHWPLGLIEAGALSGIIALVWTNTRRGWQTKLIECRLLAELCRKQAALGRVGRALPSGPVGDLGEGGLAWVAWRFAAALRAAPVRAGPLDGLALAAGQAEAAAILLAGQRAYHDSRITLGRARERALTQAGSVLFGLTTLFVLVKLVLLGFEHEHAAEQAGLAAALLPALAAALFGFRAYAELELLVQQSERLVSVLEDAEAALQRIDPDRPGAERVAGDIFSETAEAMLADVAGWIQVSRVKAVEPG